MKSLLPLPPHVQSFWIKPCSNARAARRAGGPHSSGSLCSWGPCLQSSGRCGSLSTRGGTPNTGQTHRKTLSVGRKHTQSCSVSTFFLSKWKDERSTVSAEKGTFLQGLFPNSYFLLSLLFTVQPPALANVNHAVDRDPVRNEGFVLVLLI